MLRLHRPLPSLVLAASVATILGCSGGGNPATTPQSPTAPAPANPVLESTATGEIHDGAGMPLFAAEGTVDFTTGTVELTPVTSRNVQLVEVATDRRLIDVSPFFNGDPCKDCFRVSALGMDPQGNVLADFTMRHPFSDTTLRKDLDVFDPIAIFFTSGSTSFDGMDRIDEDGNGSTDNRPMLNPNLLVGASGYTGRHDFLVRSLFPAQNYTGNINPFVSFFTESDPSPTGIGSPLQWRKLAMGTQQDTKRVTFKRPPGTGIAQINFLTVVSIEYAQSAKFVNGLESPTALGSRLNPVYFNPEFNMKEAYSVTATPGTGLIAGDASSTTKVTVFAKDWQSTAAVDPGYPNFPDYTNRAGLMWRSDLDSVKIQVPGVSTTVQSATRGERLGGTGTETDPYRFEFTITNDLNPPAGIYPGLIAVVDQYQVDGRVLGGFDVSEKYANWTAYQTVDIVVNQPACPAPTADAQATPTTAASGEDITFTSAASTGNGAPLIEYSWDFDGIPPAEFTGPNPDPVTFSYTNSTGSDEIHTATLTVKTDCGTMASDTVQVTIRGNMAPVSSFTMNPNPVDPGVLVNVDGSASSDPDAGDSIVAYEWDYDYTAPNFDIDATGSTASQSFPNAGATPRLLTIALRVRDTFAATHISTQTLTINPTPACTPPTARSGSSTTSAISGQPITYFANLSTTNSAAEFTKYTWDWDLFDAEPAEVFFPDGTGFLLPQDHIYVYTGGGTRQFRARLTVYTSDTCFNATSAGAGCDADFRCDVLVTITSNTPPIAACGATPNPVVAGLQVQFTEAGSTDPDLTGSIVKYQWDWDDRNGVNWTTPDYESTTQGGARHAYDNQSGIDEAFNATLRVIDNLGTTATCSVPMTVKPNHAPVAVASATPNPVPFSGMQVRLIDSGSSDPDAGDILTYIWDFDDSDGVELDPALADYMGTIPDTAVKVYTNTGASPISIIATLRVRDQAGATSDDTVEIVVNPPLPPPVITLAETTNAHKDNAQYNYKVFSNAPKKDWSFIETKVNAGGPWNFTDTVTWPVSATTKIRRCDLPAEVPCNPYGPLCNIVYQTLDLNQYEGRQYTPTEVNYLGISDCAQNELIYLDPLTIPYPETIGATWVLNTTGDILGFEAIINVIVGRQQYGLTTTYAGTFNALVEEAVQTVSVPELAITQSQSEDTWVSDEGYLIVDWLQELSGTTGQPTGKASGIVLNSFSIP